MRRIYILPNIFTTGNMFFGFYSIISSLKGDFERAAWAILVAMLLDVLDGSVARLAKATSEFGMQYDSLSDLVSFGIAPGILAYQWVLHSLGRMGWLTAFLFVACGALRLARFNVMAKSTSSKSFMGLPIPAAAGLVSTYYLFVSDKVIRMGRGETAFLLVLIMILASLLMVSRFNYFALKGTVSKKQSYTIILGSILATYIIASEPRLFLFLGFLGYFLSGPIMSLRYSLRESVSEELEG